MYDEGNNSECNFHPQTPWEIERVGAICLVSSTNGLLEKLRSDNGWDDFFTTVVEFCMDHGIEIPDMDDPYILRGGRARRQADNFTKEHYF